MGNRKAYILESRIIMNYLEAEFSGIAKCGKLFSDDPLQRSNQEMLMARVDQLCSNLYIVLMSRGLHQESMATVVKTLEYLNEQLRQSSTDFF